MQRVSIKARVAAMQAERETPADPTVANIDLTLDTLEATLFADEGEEMRP